ncbi:MAG: adenine phosphoribosyltransferase [Nitrososphaerota archaeon]|nr:adenine phosphoribosyltransferase [Nitrososphaerota archaeon]MDG6952952.1 adenine phosphoribosyltransferase [Nitrososphaerota archaeon]MDG6957328.1 adenine phosphoribosyltransferase [Nitrososphaerota archaeon]MDG6959572.1 adenine phosphoribosyltransferase [Nitrososphaerota archaeon]MDG6965712.1 adenine phosphoribosyltransferase [Nitrososphaerota archaeon]
MAELEKDVKKAIRNIPDYPKKGIAFKDLTTLWEDGRLTRRVTDALEKKWSKARLDKIVGIEARGFIVGAPLADRLGIGFVPARKVGKLPAKKVSVNYALEYGRQGLEMHADSIAKGDRVLVVDDLLATGGTSKAAAALVEKLGGKVVGLTFVTELSSLKGREKLSGYEVYTLSSYD